MLVVWFVPNTPYEECSKGNNIIKGNNKSFGRYCICGRRGDVIFVGKIICELKLITKVDGLDGV